ncbi:MAG TPA: hypothetical protein VFA88_05050 [Gaiellaceae bacterium]|nr:hypothetical protein [Gaiellaceae bacterium]
MIKQLLSHFKHNTIAYFALFIALGGTSYASVKIPQIAHTHSSAKAQISCGGACPASDVYWAYIGAKGGPGAVVPGAPAVYDTALGAIPAQVVHQGLGDWLVFFQNKSLQNCGRWANLVHDRGSVSVAGWDHLNPDPNAVHVLTTDQYGNPADLDFALLVLCGKAPGIQFGAAPPATGTK